MLKSFRNWRGRNTEQTDELLSAYLDGMPPMEERATLEARLRQEPALLTRLEGLRVTVRALRDLPEVETPRNFLLSPSMVAPPKAAPRPRQRRVWPVFGWATAAAALMFLLVFGSDVFIVAPSLRSQQPISKVAEFQTIVQTPSSAAISGPTADSDVAHVETETLDEPQLEREAGEFRAPGDEVESVAEALVEPQLEKEETAPESPSAAVEIEATVEVEIILEAEPATEAPRGMTSAAAPTVGGGTATVASEASEKALEVEAPPTAEGHVDLAQATPMPEGASVPSGEVADGIAVEEVVTMTPGPHPTVVAEGAPQVVSPPAEMEATESDVDAQILPERAATPDVVAAVPLTAPTPAVDTGQATKSVPLWIRLLEVGFGLAVVVLGTATLVMRRRKV